MTLRAIYKSDAALVVVWLAGSQWAVRKALTLGVCTESAILAVVVLASSVCVAFIVATKRR